MYSKLVSWEVWNFMSVAHGKCEFDERNIVNLKGYNDSGKSAMLQALKVLISNSNPTKQVSFIKDGQGYFRILATFDDNVQILRDKYSNGQSLYEMYKEGKLLFSTKSGNNLTKVTEVPEPIAEYLGLVMWDGSCLNARTCFEKQFGVQTTGSENYKAFNIVLKSEELARAGELLNNDKNKLSGDISATDAELQAQKTLLGRGMNITEEMLTAMEEVDKRLDESFLKETALHNISDVITAANAVVIPPEVTEISYEDLSMLLGIHDIITQIDGIAIPPELSEVTGIDELGNIWGIFSEIDSLHITPELNEVDGFGDLLTISNLLSEIADIHVVAELKEVENFRELEAIYTTYQELSALEEENREIDEQLADLSAELDNVVEELKAHDVKVMKCPNCGEVFTSDSGHAHIGV